MLSAIYAYLMPRRYYMPFADADAATRLMIHATL